MLGGCEATGMGYVMGWGGLGWMIRMLGCLALEVRKQAGGLARLEGVRYMHRVSVG